MARWKGNEAISLMIDTLEENTREREADIEEIAAKLERLSLTSTPSPSQNIKHETNKQYSNNMN